ncbi:hypothetical protein E3N88_38973 [Mikania micrantha]|uniref:Phospholipid scramblase n=1 Tax=Mikania micrantha TaxID=192012 RepID=A0A5N6LVH2_9ASTR|nr:hypothetical protein E3N88_38973 [Mikania micrantha]
MKKQQNDGLYTYKILLCKKFGLVKADIAESLVSGRKLHWRSYRLCGFGANLCSKNSPANLSRRFERAVHTGPEFSRDFLVQLWVADGKTKTPREKKKKSVDHAIKHETILYNKGLHGSSVTRNGHYDHRQGATHSVKYASLEEPAGFIREESNVIARQLLRKRRPFVATITDAYGNELFKVRRPFWWITSSIYAEVGGKVFTDAGQYVIRFGSASGMPVELSQKVKEFDVARPLTLLERAVTVALAVSLDNDYFSRYEGWEVPFFLAAE